MILRISAEAVCAGLRKKSKISLMVLVSWGGGWGQSLFTMIKIDITLKKKSNNHNAVLRELEVDGYLLAMIWINR